MDSLNKYIFVDHTARKNRSRANFPEQAHQLTQDDDGSFTLNTALLQAEQFLTGAATLAKKYKIIKPAEKLSDNFTAIVETITAIGQRSSDNYKNHNAFFSDYSKGMQLIYKTLPIKKYQHYECEVNYDHFRRHTDDVVTASTFHKEPKILQAPMYYNLYEYSELCDQDTPCSIDMFDHVRTSKEFVAGIEDNRTIYGAYATHPKKGYGTDFADMFVWGASYFTRRAVAKQMHSDKIPTIVDPSQGLKRYTPLSEFVADKGFVCCAMITNIMRDPAALYAEIQEETYDPLTKRSWYGPKETARYAAWLSQKAAVIEPQNDQNLGKVIPFEAVAGKTSFDNKAQIG